MSADLIREENGVRSLNWPWRPIYDPWHYMPVLAHKRGALRNGAPFKDWVPAATERVRRKLAGAGTS
jgi:hypothetical protein